jgi:microcystin-dependent protein
MPISKIPALGVDATGTPSATTFFRGDNTWAEAGAGFGTGTIMLFVQTAAPTGWTKSTTHDNKALRVVSGAASSGGSVAFTTAFASGLTAGNTTLTIAQIPSHAHTVPASGVDGGGYGGANSFSTGNNRSFGTAAEGGGGAHNHTIPSFAVSYVDVIIATKT